jgi:phage shock protein PspC (stress-responsive transcriptional regulator)
MGTMSYGTQSTTPGTGAPRGTFESTVRRMWETRPVRFPRSQSTRSWFFGVCEGIAVRYQVSPLLVRLVFVLTAFLGGVGVWVYGIALLVLRRYTVPKTPLDVLVRGERDPRYGEDRSLAVGTLIVGAVFLVFGGIFSGGITLTGIVVSAALTGVAWWLLYERQPVAPAGLLDRDDHRSPSPTAPVRHRHRAGRPRVLLPARATTWPRTGSRRRSTWAVSPPRRVSNLRAPSPRHGTRWGRRRSPGTCRTPVSLTPGPGQASGEPKKKRRGLRALIVAAVLAVVLALVAGVIALGSGAVPPVGRHHLGGRQLHLRHLHRWHGERPDGGRRPRLQLHHEFPDPGLHRGHRGPGQ